MDNLTKRDVLVEICEQPGWSPPGESSLIERWLGELQNDGLIVTRIDGWEATHVALDAYPRFEKWPEVADFAVAATPRPKKRHAGHAQVHRLTFGPHQRIEQAVRLDPHDLKGSIVLVSGPSAHAVEVTVQVVD